MPRLSKKALTAAVGVLLVVAAGVAFFQFRPLRVAVIEPQRDVVIKVFGLGTVEARVLSKIGFKVAGTLTELQVDHGDRVTAGQLLARIDNAEQQARLAKARAQLASAEAAVAVAEAASRKAAAVAAQRAQTNQRRQTLLARQAVSIEAAEDAQANETIAKADLLVTQSEIRSAKAKLDDARAQFEFERVVLNQHELTAPFDAIVVSRAKELGAILTAGEPLFTLVDPATVWALAYVDESRAGRIALGQPAEVKLRSLPGQTFQAEVVRIGLESDRVNEERRVYVRCRVCPPQFHLGEQAEVYVVTDRITQALMVPEKAIAQYDGSGGLVWTVENGALQHRRVSLGRRSLDGRIELTGGLPAGARVAAEPSAQFRIGRTAVVGEER